MIRPTRYLQDRQGLTQKTSDQDAVVLVKLIRPSLLARHSRLKIDSVYLSYRKMKSGMRQGAVLLPFLHNIYVSNRP